MATVDQILAVLTGTKVYDESTALWRVYDADGNELVDSGGVILQGLHGWLLRTAAREELDVVLEASRDTVPAGVRKAAERLRFSTTAPAITDERQSAGRVLFPTVSVVRKAASAAPSAKGVSASVVSLPFAGAATVAVGEVCGAAFRVLTPFAHGRTRFVTSGTKGSYRVAAPRCFGVSPIISGRSLALSSTTEPEAIQNPSIEMLSILW